VVAGKYYYRSDRKKQPIRNSLNEVDYWSTEIFCINFVLMNMDYLSMESNQMKIYLSCENKFSNEIEIDVKEYQDQSTKRKFVSFNSNVRPLLSVSVKLPDYRMKHQLENCIRKLTDEMASLNFSIGNLHLTISFLSRVRT
jgi:hypothetical protein